jgi:class 3 adenylate cyclase/putative methionine-R-sulfoxide reductase with GAF domain
MKRRPRTGGKPAKARPRKALKLKPRKASTAATHPDSAPAGQTEVARLTRELGEAREQQIATGDVLKVISRSSFDLQVVLDTLVKLAARLCEAELVAIHHHRDGVIQFGARFGLTQEWEEITKRNPIAAGRGTVTGRVLVTGKTVQIFDVKADPEYSFTEGQKAGRFRTVLGVPLEREGQIIGVIVLARTRVFPFTDKQIEFVQNFAAQAVIAVENARVLNELRHRTTDLTEALEQQTATAQVLHVISSSPGALEPAFTTLLENAVRICDAKFGNIYRWDGEALHLLASHNTPTALAEARKHSPLRPHPRTPVDLMVAHKAAFHADIAASQGYTDRSDSGAVAAVELGGVRTILAVPMLQGSELIGSFSLYRQEVRPFSEKQVALVTNFAAQAVIAIENARLLNEIRQSLEQQTATNDVLKVISRSTFDLQAVLDTLVLSVARLCEADTVLIGRPRGESFQFEASYGYPREYAELVAQLVRIDRGSCAGRALLDRKIVHVLDALADPEYTFPTTLAGVAGSRTLLGVPLLREGSPIGVVTLGRKSVHPFNDKQIALAESFADQAAIAIENARLLTELRERTDQLQAQSQQLVDLNQQLEQRVADQVGEIERMSRLRRFLPPQVADLIVASGTEKQLESHRREITALFCDLRGFTGFSESADPEDVMALLRDYHAAIGAIIIKYSGTLERYAGDGVMVVFNDPVPVEEPALQAVFMALEMREAISGLTGNWRELGHEIGFGIGIAHGYATLGTIGFEGRFDYAAIGTVSNVASRLCDEAKPGQILISPRVLMAVKDSVTVEAVGEFELKGIRRPIAAYNVLAVTSTND